MPGTGITLSERFGGLHPWKLSSLEEEFGRRPTSAPSMNDVLNLKTLAITVSGKNKSGKKTEIKSKKYTTTCLHKLFSQKSTVKEVKSDARKNKKRDPLVGKTRLPPADKDKSKSQKPITVQQGDKLDKSGGSTSESKQTDKSGGITAESKQSDKLPNVSVNPPRNGPVPNRERPRDPRLWYGKGSYSALAKKPESNAKPDTAECPGKSQNKESIAKSLLPNRPGSTTFPIKKQKRSFGESLTAANGAVLDGAGKKQDGDKTIQVVKRNAVTKQITGVVQLSAKRKPSPTNNQNKPPEARYQSSHNALQRIAEAKKVEAAATVVTPQALKGILKKSTTSVDSAETNGKPQEVVETSSEVESVSQSSKSGEDRPNDSRKKQSAAAKKYIKNKRRRSNAATKFKSGLKNRKAPETTKEANIVLKLSILPTIDNGKLNLRLVSSSEDDQEKSGSTEQKEKINLPLSIQTSPNSGNATADGTIDLEKPTQITVTDEDLKKGSPIQVRISNGTNSHSPMKIPDLNKVNAVINGGESTLSVASDGPSENPCASPSIASTNTSDAARTTVEACGPHRSASKSISSIASANIEGHPWISDNVNRPTDGHSDFVCPSTTAGNTTVVPGHQSVVEVKSSRAIPISYVYGTVAASNKKLQGSPSTPQIPVQSGNVTVHSPVQQQFSPTISPCMIPQSSYNINISPNHEPCVDIVNEDPQTDESSEHSNKVSVTVSPANELHGVSSMPSHTSPTICQSNTQGANGRPISVVIQQNPQKTHNMNTKENGSKPVHRTLTAIARANETEQTALAGSDNLEVVDMDLSTPSRCVTNGSINEMSSVPGTPQPDNAESCEVGPSVASDIGQNASSISMNSEMSEEKSSEGIDSFNKSDVDMRSKSEEEHLQVSHWTTYLHEDTNSPLKSAFGSKQSFTEALTSLQETMQHLDHTSSPDILDDVTTPPKDKTSVLKEPYPEGSSGPTQPEDANKEKSLLQYSPEELVTSSSANQVMQHIPDVSGDTAQQGSSCDRDVPRSDSDTTTESASVQNSVNMKPTYPLNISLETDKNAGHETANAIDASQLDEERNVPGAYAKSSSETGKRDNVDSNESIGAALEKAVRDVSSVSSNVIKHRGMFENTHERSKSPGTPVEDEHMEQDPFSLVETIRYTVQESRAEHPEAEESLVSMRRKEETKDTHAGKERNSHSHSRKHRKHIEQVTHRTETSIGMKRRSCSPRNQPTSNVYMRELSSVSDISMDEEYYEERSCQEALEPLLVRGSSRDSREQDFEEYQRDVPSTSRRESYDDNKEYSDRKLHTRREHTEPASRSDRNEERSAYPQHDYEGRDHRFDSPDRPTPRFREEDNHWRYNKSDMSPRRDTGQFQSAPPNLQVREQLTAVQALQMQINAAVNPAHRAALVLALQALTGAPMQSSQGETRTEDKMVSDQREHSRERSDEVSSNRSYDSVRDGPSNRKVEFTVLLRDDDEKLLRKDKRARNEDHGRVRRPSRDSEERYQDLSSRHHHDSKSIHGSESRAEHSRHGDRRKDRISSYDLARNAHVERTKSESSEKDVDGEIHMSGKRKHRKSPPEGSHKKQKKTNEKKSKKKYFHGRPLIKDKTNKTDPHSIPLENKVGGDDPRRSVTPDPECSPEQLKTLVWPPTPKQSTGISKKHKLKDKKDLKSVAVVTCSKETERMEEEFSGRVLSSADNLVKENAKECPQGMNIEDTRDKDVTTAPDGKKRLVSQELPAEQPDASDQSVEQTIEAFVDEVRQEIALGKETKDSLAEGDLKESCSTSTRSPTIHQSERTSFNPMESISEAIRNRPSSENRSPSNASRKSTTPSKSLSGDEKRKSHDSRKHRDKSKDSEESSPSKRSHQKRRLGERSPEPHRKYRHSESDRESTRRKRKYHDESESDIDDSDTEQGQDERSKRKQSSHFSRFTRDWRSRSRTFRRRFQSRERTSLSHTCRFNNYRNFLYSGNLGKPYGSQITDNYLRSIISPSLYTPYRGRAYCVDIVKEVKNSPSKSMAHLGYKNVPWKDIHAGLAEIKAKMLSLEETSRQVRRASAALIVGPLLKIHKETSDALNCIIDEVGHRNAYERREMYLHRRKYEILMTDIRIHAEVLGNWLPPDQEKKLLSEFIPNTTGIPRIDPAVELKIMYWVRNMDHSGMLKAWKDVFFKKFRSLQKKADEFIFKRSREKRARWGRKLHVRSDSPNRRRKHESGSDRSPDTTGLENGLYRNSDQPDPGSSPEITSCPEMGSGTPEAQVQARLEPHSEIRLPTYLHTMQDPAEYPESIPSSAFRNPPEPVRKLMSSSEIIEGMLLPMSTDGGEDSVFFKVVDSLEDEDQMHDDADQSSWLGPSQDLPIDFVAADSSSIDQKNTQPSYGLSPDCSNIPDVSHTSTTPPCTSSSFIDSHKPSSAPVSYPHMAKFFTSRVQRFASQTRMSPEAVFTGNDRLTNNTDQSSKQDIIQQSLSSAEEPSSQGDATVRKSQLKSSSYSKKRHFLDKFQSDGHNSSSGDALKQSVTPKITDTNLKLMYDEFDKSCQGDDCTNITGLGKVSSPSSSNTQTIPGT